MSNIPNNINKEHIISAIQEIDNNGISNSRRNATEYALLYNNKEYPPKYVISIANKFANNEELSSNDFNSIQSKTFLTILGFECIKKSNSLKRDFAKWLLDKGQPSYKQYLGDTIDSIEYRLDEINNFFSDKDLFFIDNNSFDDIKTYISNIIYSKSRSINEPFFEYSDRNGNRIPQAILGRQNYFTFLDSLNNMIDLTTFKKYWEKYKEYFKLSEKEHQEKYKWQVLAQVYSKWDWSSDNKKEMFTNAFEVDGPKNLWLSGNFYPIAHTSWMFENFEDETINNFNNLFNESIPLIDRINSLIDFYNLKLTDLQKLVPDKNINYHSHNDLRAIALYLSLQYPEKYFLFKFGMVKKFCEKFNLPKIKAGDKKNLDKFLRISNEVLSLIKKEDDFINVYRNFTDFPSNYNDEYLHLLTQDFIYSVANHFDLNTNYWRIGSNDGETSYYNEMLSDNYIAIGWNNIGNLDSKDINDKKEIINLLNSAGYNFNASNVRSRKAGEIFDFYRNAKIDDIVTLMNGNTVLAIGKITSQYNYNSNLPFTHNRSIAWLKTNFKDFKISDGTNTSFFKLTSKTTINKINEFIKMKDNFRTIEKKNSNQPLNQILYGPPGTGKTYKTKELAVQISNPNFVYDDGWSEEERRNAIVKEYKRLVKEGLIVFTTFHQSMSYEDFVEGIKPKTEDSKVTYEIENGIFKEMSLKASQKTVSNFNEAYNQLIKEFSDNDNDFLILKTPKEKEFKVRLNSNNNLNLYTTNKANLQGTFTQEKLEQHLYHGNVFIGWEGYASGILNYLKDKFKLSNKGINHRNYTLIIDEINRGNVSSIFGELITLLEEDKRLESKETITVKLPYSKKEFGVPNNLYIIGTMNTADRSVEALDTALRRRFSFTEVPPNTDVLEGKKIENEIELGKLLKIINDRIEILINKDYKIGHSYFLNIETLDDLKDTFKNKVIPLLEEYFFGDYGKIGLVLGSAFIELEEDKNKVLFAKSFSEKHEDTDVLREKAVYTFTGEKDWKVDAFTSIYE